MSWLLDLIRPGGDKTFRGGVHPEVNKAVTEALTVERMPFVPEYVLPLSMHIGAPAKPVVRVGDRVERGQQIAEPGGYVSTAHHAPVTGTVKAIERRPHPNGKLMPAIVIETDPYASQQLPAGEATDPKALSLDEVIRLVQQAGIVGLGGAAFPSHVKLRLPEGKSCKFLVLNGCECEPYLTCDHRLMTERAEPVLSGMRILMDILGASRGYIGVENNKREAIDALKAELVKVPDPRIEVIPLQVKYPQGAEKMLIDAVFSKEVPSGGLPLDLEIVCNNVGTMAALADLFERGTPLIERIVTVSGPGVARPRNMLVPVGTPIKAILEHCGADFANTRQVVMGGPMMGFAMKRLDVPALKGTSGILAFKSVMLTSREEYPCIKCARCLEACPLFLNPTRLALLARAERPADLLDLNALDCFECGACSYTCPSSIPLVQWIRVGKGLVRQKQAEDKAAAAKAAAEAAAQEAASA